MKRFAYTSLVRLTLECEAVFWDPYGEGNVSALNRMQGTAAKYENSINESGITRKDGARPAHFPN